MTLPNFLIVGAAKAGTTSLHHYLCQHPQICMSNKKDTAFFAGHNNPIKWNGPKGRSLSKRFITKLSDYEAQFVDAKNETAIGESSPSYLHHPEAVKGIKKYIKNPKIIIVLRHPTDRAYAHYMHGIRDAMETETTFEAALDEEDKRKANNWGDFWYYKGRSLYYDAVKSYYDTFGKENVAVYLFEDLQSDTLTLTKDIFQFLGVDPNFTPNVVIEHNISGVPKNRFIHDLFAWDSTLTKIAKICVPENIRAIVRSSVMKRNIEKEKLSSDVRKRITESFREDILKTQDLIGTDLSHWL